LPKDFKKELKRLSSFEEVEGGTLCYFFQGTALVEQAKNLLWEFSLEKGISFELVE